MYCTKQHEERSPILQQIDHVHSPWVHHCKVQHEKFSNCFPTTLLTQVVTQILA